MPDFWLVTNRDSANLDGDLESPPLVMQMRGLPPMAGMPTPVRPPRTQSSLRSTPIGEPYRESSYVWRTSSPSSITTTSTAILDRGASPDLNKPLPMLRSSPAADWAPAPEGDSRDAQSANVLSIYQFVPHEDGHISVHKAGA